MMTKIQQLRRAVLLLTLLMLGAPLSGVGQPIQNQELWGLDFSFDQNFPQKIKSTRFIGGSQASTVACGYGTSAGTVDRPWLVLLDDGGNVLLRGKIEISAGGNLVDAQIYAAHYWENPGTGSNYIVAVGRRDDGGTWRPFAFGLNLQLNVIDWVKSYDNQEGRFTNIEVLNSGPLAFAVGNVGANNAYFSGFNATTGNLLNSNSVKIYQNGGLPIELHDILKDITVSTNRLVIGGGVENPNTGTNAVEPLFLQVDYNGNIIDKSIFNLNNQPTDFPQPLDNDRAIKALNFQETKNIGDLYWGAFGNKFDFPDGNSPGVAAIAALPGSKGFYQVASCQSGPTCLGGYSDFEVNDGASYVEKEISAEVKSKVLFSGRGEQDFSGNFNPYIISFDASFQSVGVAPRLKTVGGNVEPEYGITGIGEFRGQDPNDIDQFYAIGEAIDPSFDVLGRFKAPLATTATQCRETNEVPFEEGKLARDKFSINDPVGSAPASIIGNFGTSGTTNPLCAPGTFKTTAREARHKAGAFEVAPNPARQALRISWQGEQRGTLRLSLTSVTGQRVRTTTIPARKGQHTLPVQELSPGVYSLRLQGADWQGHRKVMIR